MSSPSVESTTKRAKTSGDVEVRHLYRVPGVEGSKLDRLRAKLDAVGVPIVSVSSEICFNVERKTGVEFNKESEEKLHWLLSETFEQANLQPLSHLIAKGGNAPNVMLVEVGPRLNFETTWSSNAVNICKVCGLQGITRLERSMRYRIEFEGKPTEEQRTQLSSVLYDRMTECVYEQPLESFDSGVKPEPTQTIPVMEEGKEALARASKELGLAFDDWDLEFYTKLFAEKMKRNPTDVECFDMAQSNSEHSRHWFFGGNMVIDGEKKEKTLFQMVKETNSAMKKNPTPEEKGNSIIAFHDNSSAIRGFQVDDCVPVRDVAEAKSSADLDKTLGPARFQLAKPTYHGILTCETHNFPCGIAPFQGAETGTGGRIRDVQATGAGAHVVAGTSSYCVGNLNIPGYQLPWEDSEFKYPPNMATPLAIEVEASNGASDYGNKFGEPVVSGYTRSFGMRLPNGERREWIKPIMMSAGVGILDDRHVVKGKPEKGMIVVKLGGPAYRIGMGGGAASSKVQDAGSADLDFNAVQRGDAEMENKMNRVIRACLQLGDQNPIVSIHDQGAGGNGNVLKEISEPAGAELFLSRLPIGDKTMNAKELWGAEYQENNALLIRAQDKELFSRICARENLPYGFLGEITGTGRIVVHDAHDESQIPVDLDLEDVLGKMPSKTFELERVAEKLSPLVIPPEDSTVDKCLDRVLRLLHVGSKRFLTNKVDRSVSGLVAQQQCVGPLHTPLANVGVVALSCFGETISGVATSIGEQPIKGLLSTKAMARMAVAEAITNLMWVKVTALSDVKCSGNWMWAAKLKGEGAAMYDCCEAMRDVMLELGVSVDGGKDSLSMAASVEGEVVKCPGQLAISLYAMVPDVSLKVTPDLKLSKEGSSILYIDLSNGHSRTGGSALAHAFGQIGDQVPDLDDSSLLKNAFEVIQSLIESKSIASGHDRSDGGLITTLLEMAFAGNCGFNVSLDDQSSTTALDLMFAEELGLVVEVSSDKKQQVLDAFAAANVPCKDIGTTTTDDKVTISVRGDTVLDAKMTELRQVWESTGFELGKYQTNKQLLEQEHALLPTARTPPYTLTFTPKSTDPAIFSAPTESKPKVAVLREEGTNGDREMTWAFFTAGFDVWDVTLSDLRNGLVSLDDFRGIVFCGGFSFADVLDSAKGWAGGIHFNDAVREQFTRFRKREDTFSLGVCNGCQLMALLGWVPGPEDPESEVEIDWTKQPRFIHNASEKYESRFPTVRIEENSPAMMLKGMEGSKLGVWIAHAEGKAYFPDTSVMDKVISNGQACVRYVNDNGVPTEEYPSNPNGSPQGIAGLCSKDGRHLAMMPHPERVFKRFQWPYMPNEWTAEAVPEGPWLQMFQNALAWCKATESK